MKLLALFRAKHIRNSKFYLISKAFLLINACLAEALSLILTLGKYYLTI